MIFGSFKCVKFISLIGTPFSGKSTWAAKNFAPDSIIESDEVKYNTDRNGNLIEYLATLALNNTSEKLCLVQTNNSFKTFQRYRELLPNCELIIVNFELSLEDIKANRAESKRYKRDFKKSDRLEWYYKIWHNSLEQIKQCDLWTCITVKRVPNTMENFLE